MTYHNQISIGPKKDQKVGQGDQVKVALGVTHHGGRIGTIRSWDSPWAITIEFDDGLYQVAVLSAIELEAA